jgi:hypothetical protein
MAWTAITAATLLSRVSGPEKTALESAALATGQTGVLDDIAAMVRADWRGGLRLVTAVDSDATRLPGELLVHVLADFRYRAFTRLPGMRSLLDEARVREWERAMKVRDALSKNSYTAPDDPVEADSVPVPSITVPTLTLD